MVEPTYHEMIHDLTNMYVLMKRHEAEIHEAIKTYDIKYGVKEKQEKETT